VTIARFAITATIWLAGASSAWAQFGGQEPQSTSGPVFGAERTQRWRIGMTVTAQTPCFNIFGTLPVPTQWPEQDVKVVEEQIGDTVQKVDYRTLGGGIRQMLVMVPQLNPGERADAIVTLEVTRRAIEPPTDPESLSLPEKTPRDARRYLAPSPQIDSRNRKVRDLAQEITADKEKAWRKVEALHGWVRENIKTTNDKLKGTLTTLESKSGRMDDLVGLFVALCRSLKIPARMVWVPDYSYAEFYLEDAEGEGHWFPCELGERAVFGALGNQYLILQKGDNIEVPELKEPQRFVAEFVKGKGRPQVSFVRQVMGAQ
jgi:hypothetical protein